MSRGGRYGGGGDSPERRGVGGEGAKEDVCLRDGGRGKEKSEGKRKKECEQTTERRGRTAEPT